jgi:hypothetical protein
LSDADDLYALDPDEFVPARDKLVRALSKTDPKAAVQVRKLRRPTVAAWAINRVVRDDPEAIGALLDAGERLRDAQERALRGDAKALRKATDDRRRAVATVAALVAEVLGDRASGQSAAVSATLEAATVDESVAALLRQGRLDRERSAANAGFGFGDVGDWTPPPKTAPAKKAAPKKRAEDKKRLDEAMAESRQRGKDLHDAEAEVTRLKKALAEAQRAARDARTKANRAELAAEALRQRAWEEADRART